MAYRELLLAKPVSHLKTSGGAGRIENVCYLCYIYMFYVTFVTYRHARAAREDFFVLSSVILSMTQCVVRYCRLDARVTGRC